MRATGKQSKMICGYSFFAIPLFAYFRNPTYNDYVTTLNYSGDDYESEWITGPAEIRACFINKREAVGVSVGC